MTSGSLLVRKSVSSSILDRCKITAELAVRLLAFRSAGFTLSSFLRYISARCTITVTNAHNELSTKDFVRPVLFHSLHFHSLHYHMFHRAARVVRASCYITASDSTPRDDHTITQHCSSTPIVGIQPSLRAAGTRSLSTTSSQGGRNCLPATSTAFLQAPWPLSIRLTRCLPTVRILQRPLSQYQRRKLCQVRRLSPPLKPRPLPTQSAKLMLLLLITKILQQHAHHH